MSRRSIMTTKLFRYLIVLSGFVAICSYDAFSQTNQNLAMVKVDSSSSSRAELEAAIRKTIEDEDNGYARLDVNTALAHMSDEEGMYYDRDEGRSSTQALKQILRQEFALAKSDPRKYEYEITK